MSKNELALKNRFRGYFPVIIDVETGGLEPRTDALLELAAISVQMDESGILRPHRHYHAHVKPFEKARLDPKALEFNGIDPHHPFRLAIDEKEVLQGLFDFVRAERKETDCKRAVLVGHNSWFDLAFMNEAIKRTKIKRNPFHAFTSFDTATMGALCYGQTVLSVACERADIPFDAKEAHSALYDARKTADLFCEIINRWKHIGGWPLDR